MCCSQIPPPHFFFPGCWNTIAATPSVDNLHTQTRLRWYYWKPFTAFLLPLFFLPYFLTVLYIVMSPCASLYTIVVHLCPRRLGVISIMTRCKQSFLQTQALSHTLRRWCFVTVVLTSGPWVFLWKRTPGDGWIQNMKWEKAHARTPVLPVLTFQY